MTAYTDDESMPTFLVDNDGTNPPTITEIPPARPPVYTDDDVTAAYAAFWEHNDSHDGIRAALDAVAPAIAARALREAADQIEADRKDHWFSAFDAATRLRARAEQVNP